MKKIARLLHDRIMSFALIGCLLASLWPSSSVSAASTNQLFITPASSQMNLGTTFTISVKSYNVSTDSNNCINGNSMRSDNNGCVDGIITYPTNLLQIASGGISTTGSSYGTQIVNQSPGTIAFKGSRSPGIGTAHIFSITFQAIGTGTATVGFANNSTVNGATTLFKSGVYTIINPNPPSQPSQPPPVVSKTPTPVVIVTTPTPTPIVDTSTIEPEPTPDPSGLIDSVSIDPLYQTGSVTWKVNAPNASASVAYGSSASQLDKQAAITKKDDGSFTAKLSDLTPGNRYYFTITAKGDSDKNGTYSGTILMRGFPVVITVTENGSPAKGAQVKIGSRTYSTTADGKASIGLAVGNYSGTITTDTATLTINLSVEKKSIPPDGTAPGSQAFTYNLTSSPLEQGPESNFSILTFIAVLLGGTFILGVGFIGFMGYRRRQFDSNDDGLIYQGGSTSTVVIDDGYTWHDKEPGNLDNRDVAITNQNDNQTPSNSVTIDDEEPLDMFEKARLEQYSPRDDNGSSTTDDSETAALQNPNLPHSTRP